MKLRVKGRPNEFVQMHSPIDQAEAQSTIVLAAMRGSAEGLLTMLKRDELSNNRVQTALMLLVELQRIHQEALHDVEATGVALTAVRERLMKV